jgi:shikimate kinase
MNKSIILIGMAGCGKSTIGQQVSKLLNKPFIDLDDLIVQRFGPIPELFKQGEAFFREHESQALMEACTIPGAVIATGGGVVTVPQNMAELKKSGVIVFIDRPIHKIVLDIDVSTRPLYVCGIEALNTTYNNRLPLYRQYADYIVENDTTLTEVCQRVSDLFMEGNQ